MFGDAWWFSHALRRQLNSNFLVNSNSNLHSGATPERATLEGVIPFQARVHLPLERLPGRTPVCDGSDSLHTGAVPKTEHNEGADPKTELKKLNTALLLVCWSVSLLFCRVSFLVRVLPLGPRLCLSAMGFRDAFFQRKGDDPRTTFGRYSFTKLDCGVLWQLGYAVWVRDIL